MKKLCPRKVYVLVIENPDNDILYVFRSRSGVQRELDEYVKKWWDHEMDDRPMPRKRRERIDEYFREMSDNRTKEFYSVTEAEVL